MWCWNYKSWGIWDAVKEFVRVTCKQLVKQDMFSAMLEVCILTYLQLCECKFVTIFLFCDFFLFCLTVNMSLSSVDMQDFCPAPRPKRKRGPLHTSDGASSSFASPNQFAVLSNSESEVIGVPPQPNSCKSRIPPIVIYIHSTTLKKANEKLATPVDVKSKSYRLWLCKTSVMDYNVLLAEIPTTKLAYHTYPLPDIIQPRVVLKVIPPNVLVDKI